MPTTQATMRTLSTFLMCITSLTANAAAPQNPAVPENLGGFNELLEYILPSPHQEDAGSCYYMATTGIAEWWLTKLHPYASRESNGTMDLSERYLMNIGAGKQGESSLANWTTDSILMFNKNNSQAVLNRDYPFTKGWYIEGDEFNSPAQAGERGAKYGTGVNWISEISQRTFAKIDVPVFSRQVIFANPAKDQWSVAVAPRGVWRTVRDAIATQKAPVLVIYNHNMIWHTVYIAGFNDEIDNGNCAFTTSSMAFLASEVRHLQKDLRKAKTRERRDKISNSLKNTQETLQNVESLWNGSGGCQETKGVFYVRDSWENNPDGELYDYDSSTHGEEKPYSKAIVFREYEWLDYFANTIVLVRAELK